MVHRDCLILISFLTVAITKLSFYNSFRDHSFSVQVQVQYDVKGAQGEKKAIYRTLLP